MNNLILPLSIYLQEGVRLLRCGDDEQAMHQFSYACLLWMDTLEHVEPADSDKWCDGMLQASIQRLALAFERQDLISLADEIEYRLLPLVQEKEEAR